MNGESVPHKQGFAIFFGIMGGFSTMTWNASGNSNWGIHGIKDGQADSGVMKRRICFWATFISSFVLLR